MSRGKYNALEKLTILEEVSSAEIGFLAATKKDGINETTLMKWQRRYKLYGYKGLESHVRSRSYTAELKIGIDQNIRSNTSFLLKIKSAN
ncbi:hypothetical protein [Candidatus Pristimantibacillus sp. PTI5]|uniref:hypothetical protein n=1 Tax=Candidatus Pristimantibacillus sp. PTI5 TaxID=3400422 RepID=UPI003B01ED9C